MRYLRSLNSFVWGVPILVLILCVGLYLSLRTGFIHVKLFPAALKMFIRRLTSRNSGNGKVTPYQALCTALAATIGTGNLAGVAGAIALGGPGAIFWMWMCALLGMMIKFAEATLAVHYKTKNANGDIVGGPMYMIQNGLGNRWKWLGAIYCFFAVVAAFGAGNATQINALIGGINSVICAYGGRESTTVNVLIGMICAILIAAMLLGGARKIGRIAEKIVPFASVLYIGLGLAVLVLRSKYIPQAFAMIINGAFHPRAVTGGIIGSLLGTIRIGASRGVFTNEAGMGTASIAHASADVSHPVEQGLLGIIEVFIDTLVICTLTALVILSSGVTINYGVDTGVVMTTEAFSRVLGHWVCIPIALVLCVFAFATVMGWGLYGARCAEYLFGEGVWNKFAWLSGLMVLAGAVLKTGDVWILSETINGLMSIPNLIALGLLSPKLVQLVKEYKESPARLGRR